MRTAPGLLSGVPNAAGGTNLDSSAMIFSPLHISFHVTERFLIPAIQKPDLGLTEFVRFGKRPSPGEGPGQTPSTTNNPIRTFRTRTQAHRPLPGCRK